jgi:hypothetical protein
MFIFGYSKPLKSRPSENHFDPRYGPYLSSNLVARDWSTSQRVILIQHVETKLLHDDRPENEKMEQKFMEAEADEFILLEGD